MKKSRGFADQSIGRTYHRLRMLAGGALIGMPLLIACSGFFFVHELEPSLSDYYFAVRDGGLPRTLFLMFLAFLGGVLYSYRGLDDTDNLIHNVAGIFAFGVALFPMACDVAEHPDCVHGLLPVLHLPMAGLMWFIRDANSAGRRKFAPRPEEEEIKAFGAPSAPREAVEKAAPAEVWSDIP